jgi:Mg2+ and Co2+ transporter CorA
MYSASVEDKKAVLGTKMNDMMTIFAAVSTVFIPLQLISALWGMNVLVPGSEEEDETPFYILAALLLLLCALIWYIFKRNHILA